MQKKSENHKSSKTKKHDKFEQKLKINLPKK